MRRARSLSKLIRDENKKERAVLITFVGRPGIGKTWASIDLAYKMDKDNFTVDCIYIDIVQHLGTIIKRAEKGAEKFNTHVQDDAGVVLYARNFSDITNKIFAMVTQSFREVAKLNLFFTVPSFHMIDKDVRYLCNYLVNMKDWGYGVLYQIYPDYLGVQTKIYRIKRKGVIRFDVPPQDIISEYIEKKRTFLVEKYKDWLDNLTKKFKGDDRYTYKEQAAKIAEIIANDPSPFLIKRKDKLIFSKARIQEHFNIGERMANRVIGMAKRRLLRQFKSGNPPPYLEKLVDAIKETAPT